MALTQAEKDKRVRNGKALILVFYQNAGLKVPYSELEKVLQATDSFASEPFYQRLGGMIESAMGAGVSSSRINSAIIDLAKKNYGQLPATRDIGIFGQMLVDLASSPISKVYLFTKSVSSSTSELIKNAPSAAGIMNVFKYGGPVIVATYALAGALGIYALFKAFGKNAGRGVGEAAKSLGAAIRK